jgi:transcription initiation factor TFIIIB Brf1 subunit/transcription initiation factor TFIIB
MSRWTYEMPRIGECPECQTPEVAVILTETGQVLCSACGEDIGKPAVVEGPGYDSLWHLHPHEHTEQDEEWLIGHRHGGEWGHNHNHRVNEWDEYSYNHHQVKAL